MAEQLSYGDQVMLYNRATLRYEGAIVTVIGIDHDNRFQLKDLKSGDEFRVEFVQSNFKPALGRIGFINCASVARYATRMPARRYNIGITRENTQVLHLDYIRVDNGKAIPRLQEDDNSPIPSRGLALALENVYPTFEEAVHLVRKRRVSVAFDKQFAVCHNGGVYFKTGRVGVIPHGRFSVDDIVWDNGQDYLRSIIGTYDAKNIRTFRTA